MCHCEGSVDDLVLISNTDIFILIHSIICTSMHNYIIIIIIIINVSSLNISLSGYHRKLSAFKNAIYLLK